MKWYLRDNTVSFYLMFLAFLLMFLAYIVK